MKSKCCAALAVLSLICAITAIVAIAGYEGRVTDMAAPAQVEGRAGTAHGPDGHAPLLQTPASVTVEVVSVYDGDTFNADIDGYPAIIGHHIGVRINGIDTPELKDKRPAVKRLAVKAREYAARRLEHGDVVELRNMERDKYFRIVADVYVDGVSLGGELLDNGLAKPYDGGTKSGW